jgi:hypothetical protein
MLTTLDKVRLFERYLELTQGHSDPTLDSVMNKLLERKRAELSQQCDTMRIELDTFESQHRMPSTEFFGKFEQGELGDAMDFLEWSATWQMYNNALRCLKVLSDPAN